MHCCRPERTAAWLNGLSDGYILFDDDILRKIEGPVVVTSGPKSKIQNRKTSPEQSEGSEIGQPGAEVYRKGHADLFDLTKPYFIGQKHIASTVGGLPSVVVAKRDFAPPPVEGLRRTPLFDEHRRLGARLVPFAGWEMPVWYTSIAEEHRAVRQTAGLFDVGHMGVLEVAGEGAASFLDALTTNYVRWLRVGECQYTYLLDPDGQVIDDLLVYCRAGTTADGRPQTAQTTADDRRQTANSGGQWSAVSGHPPAVSRQPSAVVYMLVVNAVNAEKVLAWLCAVQSREVVIDRAFPHKEIADTVTIRDLKDTSSGDDRRIDLALQGPKALSILRRLAADERMSRRLGNLRRFEFTEGQLDGVPAIISRTGYTGEEIGFEVYAHPDNAVALWKRLFEVGAEFGLKPTGLGARDSTRTEAGLPLYGHELAGEQHISPIAAGYGAFVKFHKPFFVGRDALLANEARRERKIARFRCREKGGRVISPGDPVVALQGNRVIGAVTSCAAVDGYQIGMAFVDKTRAQVGAAIGVFPLARARAAGKAIEALKMGDSVVLHHEAAILSRFMGPGGTEVNPPED
jgi:glycine hydroxymethyltransferase